LVVNILSTLGIPRWPLEDRTEVKSVLQKYFFTTGFRRGLLGEGVSAVELELKFTLAREISVGTYLTGNCDLLPTLIYNDFNVIFRANDRGELE
jgi:hypothetical protein